MSSDEDVMKTVADAIKRRAESAFRFEGLVDNQLEKLKGLNVGTFDQVSMTKESAILAALSARAMTERQHLVALEQSVLVNEMIQATKAAATALDSTDKSTARLARWTKWLVFSTTALMLATAGLVVVEWLKPEPQIVSAPNPPMPPPIVITPMPPPNTTPTPAPPTRKQ